MKKLFILLPLVLFMVACAQPTVEQPVLEKSSESVPEVKTAPVKDIPLPEVTYAYTHRLEHPEVFDVSLVVTSDYTGYSLAHYDYVIPYDWTYRVVDAYRIIVSTVFVADTSDSCIYDKTSQVEMFAVQAVEDFKTYLKFK